MYNTTDLDPQIASKHPVNRLIIIILDEPGLDFFSESGYVLFIASLDDLMPMIYVSLF